ncbi:MAG: amidohydrolase family protein [Thermoplasmata archaeon]|nr:MAG: amidohydrolase family protein [Thermoplasmata archaeon]
MLLLKDRYDVIHNFVLMDAHTHLKVNNLEGLVPSEFVRRYSKIVKDVALDIKFNEKDYRFHFPWDIPDEQVKYYDYCQKYAYTIFHPGEDLNKALGRYIGFDLITTFSANLTSSLPRDYRNANSKVREALIEKSPKDNAPHNNFRFIGFGRLDPNHSDALDAFDNVFQLGLRGLKLHPKEENFEINNKRTQEILRRAAHYNIPVIFHTQEGMANKIEELVNNTIKELIDSGKMDMLPKLKVILGHAPWMGVGNKDLYRILSHPNIFGELSTLKQESFKEFFSNSKSLIKYEDAFEVKHLSKLKREKLEANYFQPFGYNHLNYWSSKMMFGSDTPYPPSHGAVPMLKHLFSKNFIGNASDIQNILAVSALKLIPTIATTHDQAPREKTSISAKYHPKKLDSLKIDSKALGMDPVLEVFPRARISEAVFSFIKDGSTESWLFRCLFDPKKPMNMANLNPYDLSESPMLNCRMSITKDIEKCLGKD